jgi:hypothetical protein
LLYAIFPTDHLDCNLCAGSQYAFAPDWRALALPQGRPQPVPLVRKRAQFTSRAILIDSYKVQLQPLTLGLSYQIRRKNRSHKLQQQLIPRAANAGAASAARNVSDLWCIVIIIVRSVCFAPIFRIVKNLLPNSCVSFTLLRSDCECFQMAVMCSQKCECMNCENNLTVLAKNLLAPVAMSRYFQCDLPLLHATSIGLLHDLQLCFSNTQSCSFPFPILCSDFLQLIQQQQRWWSRECTCSSGS